MCVPLQVAFLRADKQGVVRVPPVFSGLNYRAAVSVALLAECCIFRGSEERFFTDAVALGMAGAAEGVSAVMVVVYEVAFGTGEFKIGAILSEGGIFSASVCRKASVIVGELCFGMFFGKEGFPHGIKHVDEP